LAVAALAVLGALVMVAAAPPSPSAPAGSGEEQGGLLFVHTPDGGTLAPAEEGSGLELTLTGVSPLVVWFTDCPARQAGHVPMAVFVGDWEDGFGDDPPNAALSVLDADDA
jgi:hypothetical protein